MIEWYTGLNGYKKCTLELGNNGHKFTTELLDVPFITNRSITEIFNDHLSTNDGKYVEVLYSGGLDSEIVLLHCIQNNIPVIAITMVIKIKGLIINTHDLYYAEKFCRENNVVHKLIDLDAESFFNNGTYLDYLTPYYITEPHVSTHLWLLEQCHYFPVIGGDWPWCHVNKENRILSPARLEFSSYDRFMTDKGINGIGNMIGHSIESSSYFINLQINSYENKEDVSLLKARMYSQINKIEPRLRSYGWENKSVLNFNLITYKIELLKKLNITKNYIKWGDTIKQLLNTTLSESSLFK
jgi:hypothetical protein